MEIVNLKQTIDDLSNGLESFSWCDAIDKDKKRKILYTVSKIDQLKVIKQRHICCFQHQKITFFH